MVRGSTLAAVLVGGLGLVAIGLAVHAAVAGHGARERLGATRALAEALGLSDIALFTEARYTRHLSRADLHSPFQDAPMAIEHFPAGSLIPAPRALSSGRLGLPREGE